MPELVTLGETCVVLVAKSSGRLRYASEFERRPGGAESTVAAGVAKLGHSAGWMSRLGDDEFGDYLLGVMRSENVDVSAVTRSASAPTGVFFRENRSDGRSAVFYYRAGSAFSEYSVDDLDEGYIGTARILHLTGITPGLSASCLTAVQRAVEIAKANNVTIIFDANYRAKIWSTDVARPCLEALMRQADHVLCGQEDLTKLTGRIGQTDQLDYLHGLGLSHIVLKLGADGAALSIDGDLTRINGEPVDAPVDRFGAGDAFAAGYIAGLLENRSLVQAAELGTAVASWSIRLPGNIESLPSYKDLRLQETGRTMIAR